MQLVPKKLFTLAAVTALGAAGLFAQAAPHKMARRNGGRFARVMAMALNLTDAQKSQVQSIFQDSFQQAKPIRQQLRQNRMNLQAAVKAGDTTQIQQLSSAEGAEMGQLAGIRANAMSKVYKTLTPDQQQKFDSLQQAMRGGGRRGAKG